MNAGPAKHILATVEFPINMPLETLAGELGKAIGGITFEREETGRFEEVPAFVVKNSEMNFVLFGLPEGENGDAYVLELSAEIPLAIQEIRKTNLEFIERSIYNKEKNSRGYLDYSDELANSLSSKGLKARKVI